VISPFVDVDWLTEHGGVVADVRWYAGGRSARAAYEEGHIPGAVFVDLDADLAGPPSDVGGRHPLPEQANFAAALEKAGIGDGDVVVAYDDQGGVYAARLVWMLRMIGHEAALLDGGIAAWPGPLETGPAQRQPTRGFTPVPWPEGRVVGIEAAASAALLLDARPRERYAAEGGDDPFDPRAGHIPGAISLPCRENLASDGRLLPVDDLRQRFAAVGVEVGTPVVSYCGSGVTACHSLLVLEHTGLGEGALFPGSWSQWSRDLSREIVSGPNPD
jgi:thiosulfate/3-mercaptopyruvate sulfurtransferase